MYTEGKGSYFNSKFRLFFRLKSKMKSKSKIKINRNFKKRIGATILHLKKAKYIRESQSENRKQKGILFKNEWSRKTEI